MDYDDVWQPVPEPANPKMKQMNGVLNETIQRSLGRQPAAKARCGDALDDDVWQSQCEPPGVASIKNQ